MIDKLWEGKVVDLNGGRPKVTIELLSGLEFVYGPCRVVEGTWTAGLLAAVTGASSAHTHAIVDPSPLAVGDEVLVAFIGGHRSRPVIVARLAV